MYYSGFVWGSWVFQDTPFYKQISKFISNYQQPLFLNPLLFFPLGAYYNGLYLGLFGFWSISEHGFDLVCFCVAAAILAGKLGKG